MRIDTQTENIKYFNALTGIRAIAAYMVFFHHYNPFVKFIYSYFIYSNINEFHIGVTLFFVLSGFLISFKYLNNNDFNYTKYFINRFSRIYPIYFILTILPLF